MTEATRAYVYRIVLAAFAIAILRGVISKDEAPVWLELVLAVLGIGSAGLATKNTSTKRKP